MPHYTLSYFDFNGGRGEDCRLALHAAGVAFTDNRIKGPQWPEMKASTPWGALPVLDVDGQKIGQSNAILTFIGRSTGQHPADPWQTARHEAIMAACEELRHDVENVMGEKDPDKRKAAREEMAAGLLQRYAARFEAQIGDGPFIGGESMNVADLKLFVVMRWLRGGVIDHVPTTVLDGYKKLQALFDAVQAHPAAVDWYASH